jgi:hypothetical protein
MHSYPPRAKSGIAFLIASAFLVGCSGGPSSTPSAPSSAAGLRQLGLGVPARAAGGPFSAAYSGRYTLVGCGPNFPGTFKLSGTGTASFLHRSQESALLYGNFCAGWSGGATLTSFKHSNNSISASVHWGGFHRGIPCGANDTWEFTVTGGTGKFAAATGSGTVTITCKSSGTYTDTWTGTLQY